MGIVSARPRGQGAGVAIRVASCVVDSAVGLSVAGRWGAWVAVGSRWPLAACRVEGSGLEERSCSGPVFALGNLSPSCFTQGQSRGVAAQITSGLSVLSALEPGSSGGSCT